MAIHDINTIQINDVDKLKTLTNEYVLQSLGNLGQRLSTAPDGITVDSFKITDFFEASENIDITSIYRNSNGSIEFRQYKVNNGKLEQDGESLVVDHTFGVVSSNKFVLDVAINGVAYYEGYIRSDEDTITTIFAGYKADKTLKEIVVDTFKKATNALISGVRIIDDKEYYIYYNTDENKDTTYKCTIGTRSGLSNIWDSIKSSICDEHGTVDSEKIASVTPESVHTTSGTTVGVNYHTTDNLGFYIDTTSDEIKTNINCFNYDVAVFVGQAKQYYTKIVYKEDNDQLKKQVLVSLFKLIAGEVGSNDEVFIPANYSFNFTCNSNDSWKIYGCETLIPVTYTLKDSDSYVSQLKTLITDNTLSTLLCTTQKCARIALYDFSVAYEDIDSSDVIYGITTTKKYTLPYINSGNMWVINDEVTDVCAKPENGGNPNIIIVKSEKGNSTGTLISSITNIDNFASSLSWTQKTAKIAVPTKIQFNANASAQEDTDVSGDLDIIFMLPNVEEMANNDEYTTILNLLKYSLIINISTASNTTTATSGTTSVDDLIDPFGKNGCITTIWYLDYNSANDTYEYKCLLQDDDEDSYAMDLNYLCDFNNLIKWQIKNADYKVPHRYPHDWLVFKNANIDVKNNDADETPLICPVIVNRDSNDYNSIDANVYNKYNLSVEYITFDGEANIKKITDKNIDSLPSNTTTQYLSSLSASGVFSGVANIYSTDVAEYLPSDKNSVPTVDFSNVLVKDENNLNRVNIISIDSTGKTFYSYIGSQFIGDKPIKDELTIGTAKRDINLSTNSMLTADEYSTGVFNPVEKININFTYTYVSTYLTVGGDAIIKGNLTSSQSWNSKVINDVTYYSTVFTPIGALSSSAIYHSVSSDGSVDSVTVNSSETDYWANLLTNYNITAGDSSFSNKDKIIANCVNIYQVVKTLGFTDEDFNASTCISTNSIIFGSGKKQFLKTSNCSANPIIIGNPLEITYYKNDSAINFIFNEHSINHTVTSIFKIQTN